MRTIAVINQKGGCGKTTVAINLAATLAAKGHRTLLVDMDPQSHCALGLAVPEDQLDATIAQALVAGRGFDLSEVVWQISANLDLAPSSVALAGAEQKLAAMTDKDLRLAQVLESGQDHYSFVLIDCPPSVGLLTFNALRAAGEIIIPVETGYFALQGSIKQAATIRMLAQRVGHSAAVSILPTMYDVRTKMAREILAELKKHFGPAVLPLAIHFNSKLKEAASFGQPITEYDPTSQGCEDFALLADHLIAHVSQPVAAPMVPTICVPSNDELALVGVSLGQNLGSGQNPSPDQSEPAPAAAPAQPAAPAVPLVNRAAELVQRAKALAARTAALQAKLNADPDVARAMLKDNLPILDPQAKGKLEEKLHALYGVRVTSQGTLFLQPATVAQEMAIAGDFNNWSPQSTPMRLNQRLQVFEACVPLTPGRYRYRLVADGRWTCDPHNTYVESNPFGELNNIVEVK